MSQGIWPTANSLLIAYFALVLPGEAEGNVDFVIDPLAAQNSITFSNENFESSSCALQEGCVGAPGLRRLLRFTTTIWNTGTTAFELKNPGSHPSFDFSACHDHVHVHDITSYELLDAATRAPATVGGTQVVTRKQGFCFRDDEAFRADAAATPVYSCEEQGLSAGWADDYDSTLDCQWLDITGLAPGNYLLKLTVNPLGVLLESNLNNNAVEIPVTIPPEQ